MKKAIPRSKKTSFRHGIGEWYGKSFIHLGPAERKHLANLQALSKKVRPPIECPFRSTPDHQVMCTKEGGVCSIRLYQQETENGPASVPAGQRGNLVTTCPHRFQQDRMIFRWIGETMLGHPEPLAVREIGFLEQDPNENAGNIADSKAGDVGRIDSVLVHPTREPMHWCALEIQAVYFSGASMSTEFKLLSSTGRKTLPFPAANRHPDFRSSGPKRLMPQLQIKIPSLRRWGKKMAVVVDRNFFDALGKMDDIKEASNSDIAWYVVKYQEGEGQAVLKPDFVRFTTLERAVEGLTGGRPVSQEVFEARIKEKLVGT
ncbi:MAG TPA: NotI family restriction endonuclease [Terriglobia bacterium]|nr:NotI family restriction endonuclease [Terriglobia bacterium]